MRFTGRLVFATVFAQCVLSFHEFSERKDCPNYQYKCPECPDSTKCVYPNSGGCAGAGVPACQSRFCFGFTCLTKALPCPKECPFSCRYTGPPCCPFLGAPICEPCETFAPCQETPCPKECPDSCFYPDADRCCPKSGQPVCRRVHAVSNNNDNQLPATAHHNGKIPAEERSESFEKRDAPTINKRAENDDDAPTPSDNFWYSQEHVSLPDAWYYQLIPAKSPIAGESELHRHTPYASRSQEPSAATCGPCPPLPPTPTWGTCHTIQNPGDCCPSIVCVGVPLSIDPTATTTTTSTAQPTADLEDVRSHNHDDNDDHDVILCADYIIPCPEECPNTCKYPTNVPCPHQHQPVCPPDEPVVTTTCITTEVVLHHPTF